MRRRDREPNFAHSPVWAKRAAPGTPRLPGAAQNFTSSAAETARSAGAPWSVGEVGRGVWRFPPGRPTNFTNHDRKD